jgi:hypothetical protein
MGYNQKQTFGNFVNTKNTNNSSLNGEDGALLKIGKVTGTLNNLNLNKKNLFLSGGVRFFFIEDKTPEKSVIDSLSRSNHNNKEQGVGNLALPLFPHMNNIPFIGDRIIILENKTKQGNPITQFYYISSLNLNNNILTPNRGTGDIKKNGNVKLGEGINEESLSKIRKLLLSSGDCTLEGKFGNTIRLGNSNTKTPWTPISDTNNDPILIIRNGQKDPKETTNPVFEDINEDNSSIYLTKGQTIPINVISPNLETFGVEEKETTTSEDTPKIELSKEDHKKGADSEPAVVPSTNKKIIKPKQSTNNENTTPAEIFSEDKTPLSDQAFVKVGSPDQIGLQPTSDPIATDPPPTPPPPIPEDADVYFLEDGTFITFETQGPKKTAVATKDGSEVYRGAPSFSSTNKILAEEVALNLNSPLYGIEDPNPNSTAPVTSTTPGGSDPNSTLLLEYNTEDGVYKIYKDNIEYYANDPDGNRFSGGYSISSHDDNTGISRLQEEIDDEFI